MNSDDLDFGFKKVDRNDKQNLVNDVFSGVASKYDLMNDLMSFGVHRLWKHEFINNIPNLQSDILDVASGSGDIALQIKKKARGRNLTSNITICDINPEMLEIAKNRAIDANLLDAFNYVCADAQELPFADNSFDYYTIAFGIRNVPDISKALQEASRVLRPMGRFLCLEFSKVEYACLKNLYDFYSFNIIPKIGQVIANNEEAYQYLVESINLFPDQDHFKVLIQDAGFSNVSYKNLTFGVAAIHSAYKL